MGTPEWRVLLCEQLYQGSRPFGEPSAWENALITLGMHYTFPLETLCTFYRISKRLRRLCLKKIMVRSLRIDEDFKNFDDWQLERLFLQKTLIIADERTLVLLPGQKYNSQNEAIFVDHHDLLRYIDYYDLLRYTWSTWHGTDPQPTKNLVISLTRAPPAEVTRKIALLGLVRLGDGTLTFRKRVRSKYQEKCLYTWRYKKLQTDMMDPEWRALFAYRTLPSVIHILSTCTRWKAMKPHKKRLNEVEKLRRDQSPTRKRT